MEKPKRTTLKWNFGQHPEIKNSIVIVLHGTQIDLNNPKHKHFVDVCSKVMATQMYAIANDIDIENIQY